MDACFTVDLDGLWCYREIHGLAPAHDRVDPAYVVGVRRLLDFLDALGIPATLFVIGRDVTLPLHRELLTEALDRGHELASHSYAHDYALRRQPMPKIRDDLRRAHESIAALGAAPAGFRAPGYNVDERILSICAELGYQYDSSVFPCPPYWLAKGGVMAWLAARGRPSRSSMTLARTLRAPLHPYRPSAHALDRPARHSRMPIEVPICVAPGIRFPVIGTSLHLLRTSGFRAIYPALRRAHPRLLNLELHAIDFMDADDPGVDELRAVQPDLSVPWATKSATYRAVVEQIARDYTFRTLRDATDTIAATNYSRAARSTSTSRVSSSTSR